MGNYLSSKIRPIKILPLNINYNQNNQNNQNNQINPSKNNLKKINDSEFSSIQKIDLKLDKL